MKTWGRESGGPGSGLFTSRDGGATWTKLTSRGLPARPVGKVAVGSPSLGKEAMIRHGCGSCHTIPGVKDARGLVGPPLVHFAKRSFIAGELANTQDNLIRWIRDPKGVEPGTAMPDLGVTLDDARNISAYLERLQ